jgi:hypothetical protein
MIFAFSPCIAKSTNIMHCRKRPKAPQKTSALAGQATRRAASMRTASDGPSCLLKEEAGANPVGCVNPPEGVPCESGIPEIGADSWNPCDAEDSVTVADGSVAAAEGSVAAVVAEDAAVVSEGVEGEGIVGEAGIVVMAPHSGHWACLPAVSSPVRNNRLHCEHRNSIAITPLL